MADDRDDEPASCGRCGSTATWRDCWHCGGVGTVEDDIGDDVCPELVDVPCPECDGRGGSLHCISSPAFCAAHPLPGSEDTPSTALESRAWSDAG